nr:putative RNA-directed DNA polymerase, eukaryota, reverse transcriptase zinc-binding domain protein [Tanacetum cinerariifolium]
MVSGFSLLILMQCAIAQKGSYKEVMISSRKRSLCASDAGKRDEVIAEIYQLEQEQRSALKQKSQIKWPIEGDENTSLIGCVYKVISNILASRLAKVIGNVISPNQTTFLLGRQIMNKVLIANEIVNVALKSKIEILPFKVDFEKAFDSVNGSPTTEFRIEKALRQGDPYLLFLFIIVMEPLQVSILNACDNDIYNGLSLANDGSNLSLLQYVDDALFLEHGLLKYAKNLVRILSWFKDASGLKVNLSKSRLYGIGVNINEAINVAMFC